MSNVSPELLKTANDVTDLIEDMVEYYCREERVSGEKVYTMIATLAAIKLSEFPDSRFYGDNEEEVI
tara:strand:- start:1398 stop:1598 length:201 start_codon:yes stop_codon:yes gene_type:complete